MRQLSDNENNKYILKANMKALIQMDELGISYELIQMKESQNQAGFKILFNLFHLFLNVGENVKYTKEEALEIFEAVVEENGLEKVAETIQQVMNDDMSKTVQKTGFKKGVTELNRKR